jgi:hypothetical protein
MRAGSRAARRTAEAAVGSTRSAERDRVGKMFLFRRCIAFRWRDGFACPRVARSCVLGVAEMVALSRATAANMRQNIAIALGLKAVFLATILIGATSLWRAILADTGGTVLVTANALRLLRCVGRLQRHLGAGAP